MKLLLDTHIVLWFFDDNKKLSKKVTEAILDSENEKYISIVSAWELAIKTSIGKLTFEGGVGQFFTAVEENGFELLPLKGDHLKQLENLPFHHRDPFDRLLIATAISEGMTLTSTDENILLYGVSNF